MIAIDGRGKFLFKEPAFLSGPVIHFAGFQHRLHGVALSFIKDGPGREWLLANGQPAIRGEQIERHVGILSER